MDLKLSSEIKVSKEQATLNASYMVKVFKDTNVQESHNKLAHDVQEQKDQVKILYKKQLEMCKNVKANSEVLLTQMKGLSEMLNMTNLKLYCNLLVSAPSPITPSRAGPVAQTPEQYRNNRKNSWWQRGESRNNFTRTNKFAFRSLPEKTFQRNSEERDGDKHSRDATLSTTRAPLFDFDKTYEDQLLKREEGESQQEKWRKMEFF